MNPPKRGAIPALWKRFLPRFRKAKPSKRPKRILRTRSNWRCGASASLRKKAFPHTPCARFSKSRKHETRGIGTPSAPPWLRFVSRGLLPIVFGSTLRRTRLPVSRAIAKSSTKRLSEGPGKNQSSIARYLNASCYLNSNARERSVCFYCLRRLTARVRCLDYVVPQVRRGSNSYRNIVSSCAECNALKGETPAEGFLRLLYRDGRLTAPNSLGGRSACGGEAPARVAQRGRRAPEAACSCKIAFAGMNVLGGRGIKA